MTKGVTLFMKKIELFKDVTINTKQEEYLELLKNSVRIERIVSNGQSSPKDFWYEQDESEFVVILKGDAILEFEDEQLVLNEGDAVNIPAFKRHRVKYTNQSEPTIWLAVFYK